MNAPFTFADAAAAAILPRIDRREAEADFLHDLAARDGSIRALLLDGITMLELLGEQEVRGMLRTLQGQLLTAVRENTILRMDTELLERAVEGYAALITAQIDSADGEKL